MTIMNRTSLRTIATALAGVALLLAAPAHATKAVKDRFSVYLLSDTQHPWTRDMDQSKSTIETESYILIASQFWSIYWDSTKINIGPDDGDYQGPRATFLLGDMTAFGHKSELNTFKELHTAYLKGLLRSPSIHYLGLGNHDIGNNVDDTYQNSAARRMWKYMKEHVEEQVDLGWRRFDHSAYDISDEYHESPRDRKDWNGNHWYSLTIGDVHFVMLQNYASYEVNWDGWDAGQARRDFFTIEPDWEWLERDLYAARERGEAIILMAHQPIVTHDLQRMMRQYGVDAYFAGHKHSLLGHYGFAALNTTPSSYSYSKSVPRYYTGSASRGIDLDDLSSGGHGAENESDGGSFLRLEFDTKEQTMKITPMGAGRFPYAVPTVGKTETVDLGMGWNPTPDGFYDGYYVIQNGYPAGNICAEFKYRSHDLTTEIRKQIVPPGHEERFNLNRVLDHQGKATLLSVNVYSPGHDGQHDRVLIFDEGYHHLEKAGRCVRAGIFFTSTDCGSDMVRDSDWFDGGGWSLTYKTGKGSTIANTNCTGAYGDTGNHSTW